MTTGITGISSLTHLLMSFLGTITKGIGTMFNTIFSGMGSGLASAFKGWGSSIGQYGIWGLAILVISVMVALILLYGFFMILEPEKDISEEEEEL